MRRGETGKPPSPATPGNLQFGDEIAARVGPDGIATEVSATYTVAAGAVREFGQVTPYAMPFVVIEGDGVRRVIDLAAPIHTPHLDLLVKAVPLGSIDIAPGDHVRLRFNPSTGRVYELWKT
jgi:hypothetical protein